MHLSFLAYFPSANTVREEVTTFSASSNQGGKEELQNLITVEADECSTWGSVVSIPHTNTTTLCWNTWCHDIKGHYDVVFSCYLSSQWTASAVLHTSVRTRAAASSSAFVLWLRAVWAASQNMHYAESFRDRQVALINSLCIKMGIMHHKLSLCVHHFLSLCDAHDLSICAAWREAKEISFKYTRALWWLLIADIHQRDLFVLCVSLRGCLLSRPFTARLVL